MEHTEVLAISSYKSGCDPLRLRRAAGRSSVVCIHGIPDRGGAAAPRGSRILNLEGTQPEGIQHTLAVPTSPFPLPLLLLSRVHHHSRDFRGADPGPTLTSHTENGEQGWEGSSTLAGFLGGAGGSLKMNSFQLSEHLQGLLVAASWQQGAGRGCFAGSKCKTTEGTLSAPFQRQDGIW